jgi:pimeloyl-ACP methyl ester carboxylesterase
VADAEKPAWLVGALTAPVTEHTTTVEGAPVHYRAWGVPGDQSVVLVHGGLAHGRWWDHVAPLLTGAHVVALDLTGHGDSGYRDHYDMRQWAREILAVVDDAGLVRPVVVGHSMGGVPATAAAVLAPRRVSGVITVDTRFNDKDWPVRDKPSRVFASVEDGVHHFAPAHPTPGITIEPAVVRHVAETSLGETERGWRWKRDDHYAVTRTSLRELLPDLLVPLAVIRTEAGVVTKEAGEEMRSLSAGPVVVVTIPGAGHNPMLEQPVALVGVLRTLLAVHHLR